MVLLLIFFFSCSEKKQEKIREEVPVVCVQIFPQEENDSLREELKKQQQMVKILRKEVEELREKAESLEGEIVDKWSSAEQFATDEEWEQIEKYFPLKKEELMDLIIYIHDSGADSLLIQRADTFCLLREKLKKDSLLISQLWD